MARGSEATVNLMPPQRHLPVYGAGIGNGNRRVESGLSRKLPPRVYICNPDISTKRLERDTRETLERTSDVRLYVITSEPGGARRPQTLARPKLMETMSFPSADPPSARGHASCIVRALYPFCAPGRR